MHGTGGRSAIRFGTELAGIVRDYFPGFVLGKPATVTSSGDPITVESNLVNDCKKAKEVLGATIRPVEDTIGQSSRAPWSWVSSSRSWRT